MQIPSLAATAACALLCLSLDSPAAADSEPTPSMIDRADAIAEAAHVTATKLRQRWDAARKQHAKTAACLEDKVAQAVVLAKIVDDRRNELRQEPESAIRARLARRLEFLEARRVGIEADAVRCK